MTYALVFTEQYEKRSHKFLRRHPELEKQYSRTLQILAANPFHPSLHLHALAGRLSRLHSVSINISYRVTLELLIDDQKIVLVNIGSHDEVYRA
jgi:mRNA-degrading endonuclease YafQ of YafQ-DinJ toxin-antitoxin module